MVPGTTRCVLMASSLKYIDSVETETHVYIATERVRPLEGVLRDWETGGALSGSSASKGKGREDWVGWGIRAVSVRAISRHPAQSLTAAFRLPWRSSMRPLYQSTTRTSSHPPSSSRPPWNGD